jgi:hypothetical protein
MSTNINNINIISLYKYEYVIFLTNRYYSFFKRKLLKYFDKYNILYLNYDNKSNILKEINNTNDIIKLNIINNNTNNNINEKEELINKLQVKKLKCLYFLENSIEPNIMYKKISFSKEELFLSFNNYAIKKMEYKFRTFCQIAEKLGAKEIKIVSKSNNSVKTDFEVNIFDNKNGIKISDNKITNYDIDLDFKYTNYSHNLLLNKFYIMELIKRENVFFITKEDFDADIDLKFLIDTRCINLIDSYDTDIIINNINEIERKVFVKALQYGLTLGYNKMTSTTTQVNIKIKFIDIYEFPQNISGHQLYPQDDGFWHLSNIIKLELNNSEYKYNNYQKIYGKINEFFKSHIYSLKYGYINIPNKNFPNTPEYNIINMYDDIIKNFSNDEINALFYEFFKNDISYTIFKQIRDLIIFDDEKLKYMITKDTPNIINKFYFTILQYKNIQNTNNIIYEKIELYLKELTKKVINDNLNERQFDEMKINNNIKQYTVFINKLEELIIKAILSVVKNNYLCRYGLENIKEEEIYDIIFDDTNIYIENNIINLIKELIIENENILITPKNNNILNTSEYTRVDENKFNYIILNKKYNIIELGNNIINKSEIIYKHKILEIISEILNIILINVCKKICNNKFLQHPLFVKKNMCDIIIKYNKFHNNNEYNNIIDKLSSIISNSICYTNFHQFKIYYTWENVLEIIKNI